MDRNGVTLIELVMVIVLIGIIAAFVMPMLGNITTTEAGSFTDKLRADMRYAQDLAMTQSQRVQVNFTANSYSITIAGNPIVDPSNGRNYPVTLGTGEYAGISLSNTFGGSIVIFDSLGGPYDSNGALTANQSVTVAPVGHTITVTMQTGAVN